MERMRHLLYMGASEEEMTALLRQRGFLPTASIRSQLLQLDDLEGVLNCAGSIGFHKGFLTLEILNSLLEVWTQNQDERLTPVQPVTAKETPPVLGRTIAPIKAPEPLDMKFRNNLPDWNTADFSENASDAPSDILVHYDITGNSITEGKMSDITSCFTDRLQSIRKMIIQNSRLPRTPTEISRLHAESSRYQG
ncbi:MAG: hypothetical protein HOH79_06170, partial [Euryarchaeota archaeon]|nr:hypothetical protein [Euryarchaeota archaeon]